MNKLLSLFTILATLWGCVPPTQQNELKIAGLNLEERAANQKKQSTEFSVSNIQLINDQFIVSGVNLDLIDVARMNGPGINEQLQFIQRTANQLILRLQGSFNLFINSSLNLILSNAYAQSSFNLNVILEQNGANDGDVLTWDDTSNTWVPQALNGIQFMGGWDARRVVEGGSGNPPSFSPNNGEYWIVSIAGTQSLSGENDWQVGDWAIYNGSDWQKINNSPNVLSFNGRKGAVTSQVNDYSWAQIDKTTSSLNDVADVDYATFPTNGDILLYNSTSGKWEPSAYSVNNITTSQISDGTIIDADISTTAAIDMSKINGLIPALGTKVNATGGTISGNLNLGPGASINMAVGTTVDGVDVSALDATVTLLNSTKQDNIAFPGDSSKYLSGNNTFEDISALTLTAQLTGLDVSGSPDTTINVSDSIVGAFGKLQQQLNSFSGSVTTSVQKSGDVMFGDLDLSGNVLSAGQVDVTSEVNATDLNLTGAISMANITLTSTGTVSAIGGVFSGNTESLTHTVNDTLKLKDNDGTTNYVTIQSNPALAANYTLLLPVDDGTPGQVLSTNGTGVLSWFTLPVATSGTVTDVTAGVGLLGGTITSSGTIDVNVGVGANQIVQLDGSSRLPAVDGSLLTNLTAGNIVGLGSMSFQDSTAVSVTGGTLDSVAITNSTATLTSADIDSGTIDGTSIGLTTPSSGDFSTIGATTPGSGIFTTLSATALENTPIGVTTPNTAAFTSIDADSGTLDNASLGGTTPITYLGLDNLVIDGSTISSVSADSDILLIPNGAGNLGVGQATPNTKLSVSDESAVTNAVVNVLEIATESSGTAANGLGVGMLFNTEDDSGSVESMASIEVVSTSVANGAETARMDFKLKNAGAALSTVLSLDGLGNLTIPGDYVTSTITDSDGNTSIHVEKTGGDDNIRFDTSGTERMIVTPAGYLGLGTSSPGVRFHISDTLNGEGQRLEGTTHFYTSYVQNTVSKAIIGHENANDDFLTIKTQNSIVPNAGDIYLQPDTGAHVGIKTNDPLTPLEVMEDDINNSDITSLLTLTHMADTPANGIGAGIIFRSENNATLPTISASITSALTDITNGAEDGNISLSTLNGGTIDNRLVINSDGETFIKTGHLNVEQNNELRLHDSAGGEYVGLKSPEPLGATYTLTLPANFGTNGQALTSDGAGNLNWVTPPLLGLTPTDSTIIVGDGANWVAESGDTARTSLGLGPTNAVTFFSLDLLSGTNTSITNDGVTFTDAESFYVQNQSNVGVILNSGATAWAALSDRRKKRDIAYVSVEKLSSIQGVYYKYLTDDFEADPRVGVIAQEVQAVLPEAVSIDKDGYLRVRLTEIIPLLINATNEQQKELDKNKEMLQVMKGSLDLRVANLEERVEKLESENAMLKSYLCSQDPNAPFCK